MVTIDYLANHRDCIPQLAAWSHAQWRPIFDQLGMSIAEVVESFDRRAQIDTLSLGLVALSDGVVVGTGALKAADLPIRSHLTPWLGGMLVASDHRNAGVGSALVKRLITEAQRLNLPRLYLWTPNSESLYARFGWQTFERLEYCGYQIALMERTLASR